MPGKREAAERAKKKADRERSERRRRDEQGLEQGAQQQEGEQRVGGPACGSETPAATSPRAPRGPGSGAAIAAGAAPRGQQAGQPQGQQAGQPQGQQGGPGPSRTRTGPAAAAPMRVGGGAARGLRPLPSALPHPYALGGMRMDAPGWSDTDDTLSECVCGGWGGGARWVFLMWLPSKRWLR